MVETSKARWVSSPTTRFYRVDNTKHPTSSIPVFEDDWEKVVAAAELAESMVTPPKIALFEGDWDLEVFIIELNKR